MLDWLVLENSMRSGEKSKKCISDKMEGSFQGQISFFGLLWLVAFLSMIVWCIRFRNESWHFENETTWVFIQGFLKLLDFNFFRIQKEKTQKYNTDKRNEIFSWKNKVSHAHHHPKVWYFLSAGSEVDFWFFF